MARPRKQTYTLDMYLKKIQNKTICNDADVQRKFAWKPEHINELIVTVLTDDYIPPIILGEEVNSQLHIVDGGCRTAALVLFKYFNYKITSSIENPIITYQKKVMGNDGEVTWEETEYNIKNKTYDKLPEELKEKFDEYQIETVIHEMCDSTKISKYIKRYNNHVNMNTEQKAFTYIDKFAGKIHKIIDSKFFVDCSGYSDSDKNKGVVERSIVEALMCSNHFGDWKTDAKSACKYLNQNATEKEFDIFADNLHRLEIIITKDIKDVFNKKDAFIFFTLFNRFTKLGVEDVKFAEFIREFKNRIRNTVKNAQGMLFDEIDKGNDKGKKSTKNKQVVSDKLDMLEKLMLEYLHITDSKEIQKSAEEFIAETLDMDTETVKADMDCYSESLDLLLENTVRWDSKLRNEQNRYSMLAIMVYSYSINVKNAILEEWMTKYAAQNNCYYPNQTKNFLHMKQDFEQYLNV